MAKPPMPPKMPMAKAPKSGKAIGKQPAFGKMAPAVAPPMKGGKAAAMRKARLAGKKF